MLRTIKYILVEFSHEVYAMLTFSAKCLFFICVRVIVLEICVTRMQIEKTYLIQLLKVLKFYKFYSTPISFMHILVLFSCWAQSDYSLFIVIS